VRISTGGNGAIEELPAFTIILVQPLGNNALLLRKRRCKNEDELGDLTHGRQIGASAVYPRVAATADVPFLSENDSVFRSVL
jgi:hypothetical protein